MRGIVKSNRTAEQLLRKGSINGAFPIALLGYMEEIGVMPVFLEAGMDDGQLVIFNVERPAAAVIGPGRRLNDIHYLFESKLLCHKEFLDGNDKKQPLKNVDVVFAADAKGKRQYTGLEVKLAAVPDVSTARGPKSEHSCEMVLRPNSIAEITMSIYRNLPVEVREELKAQARSLNFTRIRSTENPREMLANYPWIREFVEDVLKAAIPTQVPIMAHAVWATIGNTLEMETDAFDLFMWTDVGLLTMVFSEAQVADDEEDSENRKPSSSKKKDDLDEVLTRTMRTVMRFAIAMNELLKSSFFNREHIFENMSFGSQSDKDCSIRGKRMNRYIVHPAMAERRVKVAAVEAILGKDGARALTPERRLDAAVVYREMNRFERGPAMLGWGKRREWVLANDNVCADTAFAEDLEHEYDSENRSRARNRIFVEPDIAKTPWKRWFSIWEAEDETAQQKEIGKAAPQKSRALSLVNVATEHSESAAALATDTRSEIDQSTHAAGERATSKSRKSNPDQLSLDMFGL